MKSWPSSCFSTLACVHFISLSARFFPHVTHVRVRDGFRTDAERYVRLRLSLCKWGVQFYALQILEVRGLFFMATPCCKKGFLRLWDIVSFKYEFYCWEEAPGEQRVRLIIPVFAEENHLYGVDRQRRDSLYHVEHKCPRYLGDRRHKHKHGHIYTRSRKVTFAQKLWHSCTIKNMHAVVHIWTVRQHSRWPEWFVFWFCSHCRISKTLMSTPDWIYDHSIPRYLRWSRLSLCTAGKTFSTV